MGMSKSYTIFAFLSRYARYPDKKNKMRIGRGVRCGRVWLVQRQSRMAQASATSLSVQTMLSGLETPFSPDPSGA